MAQTQQLAASLQAALAIELRHVRVLIENLAEILVMDPHFAENYLDQLQAFDLLVQCTDESAAILDRLALGACSHTAIAPVRLSLIKDRLHAALTQAA